MGGIGRFEIFIADLIRHHDALEKSLPTRRSYVIASAQIALAQLRMAKPADEGEELLLESAIELFEELIEKARGQA
jgi:hypothetical protein